MSDFLDQKRSEIEERLAELKPLVEEHLRLQEAAAALAGVGGSVVDRARKVTSRGGAKSTRRSSAKPRTGTGKRGRPKGTGKRAAQALALVKSSPGITIPELAKAMNIKQNYLYRVMPTLQSEKKVTKKGKGWHAV